MKEERRHAKQSMNTGTDRPGRDKTDIDRHATRTRSSRHTHKKHRKRRPRKTRKRVSVWLSPFLPSVI